MRFWPGCGCCEGDGGEEINVDCPCTGLPDTFYLTFSRQIPGLYDDATLVAGPAPPGYSVGFLSPYAFWWGEEHPVSTMMNPASFDVTDTFYRHYVACYVAGTGETARHEMRLFAQFTGGAPYDAIGPTLHRATTATGDPPAPVYISAGPEDEPFEDCSPFTMSWTQTHSGEIAGDGDETLRAGHSIPGSFTLVSPIDCLLSA